MSGAVELPSESSPDAAETVTEVPEPTEGAGSSPGEAEPPEEEPAVNHIVFGVGDARYAVSIHSVLELDRLSRITPVPNTPEFVLGVTNVRGEVLSVLDLRRLLGMPGLARPETGRLIQVRPQGQVVRSGLLVDSILGMRPVRVGSIEPYSTDDARVGSVVDGLYPDQPEPLRVLSVERLFELEQIQALLRGVAA